MIEPMLAKEVDIDGVDKYLDDSNWIMQEKRDGVRALFRISSDVVTRYSRSGEVVQAFPLEERVPYIHVVLDGEVIGNKIVLFDLIQPGLNESMAERSIKLMHLYRDVDLTKALRSHTEIVKMYVSSSKREALFGPLMDTEGVVFKKAAAPYTQGRSDNWIKFRHRFQMYAIVGETNYRNKAQSARLMHYDGSDAGGLAVPVNHGLKVGDIVKVEYLHLTNSNKVYGGKFRGKADHLEVNPRIMKTQKLRYQGNR